MPWLKNDNKDSYKSIQPLLTTEYAEVQNLNHLNNVCRKAHFVKIDKNLIRHRAKLALRRLKRNKQLPLFNLDKYVLYHLLLYNTYYMSRWYENFEKDESSLDLC